MGAFTLEVAGKKLFTYYKHYIMEKTFYVDDLKSDLKLVFKEITPENIDDLKELNGFDMEYVKKLLGKYKDKVFGLEAIADNVVVGYVWCVFKGARDRQYLIRKTDIYIFDVFVKEQFRGHNIAPLLINELVKKYIKIGETKTVCLAVRRDNVSAILAYKKIGFVVKCKKSFFRILKVNVPQHKL